jgi:DNA primase
MDVLTSHQFGWQNTVASMGTALTNRQVSILKRLTKNILLAMDTDTAGEEATLRVAETIDVENYVNNEVKVIVPTGGKDPDEIIRKDNKLWQDSLENAMPLIDFIFRHIKEKYDLSTLSGKSDAANTVIPIIFKIKDPIKKGEYVQRFAKIININENYLLDGLNKISIDTKKRQNRKSDYLTKPSVDILGSKPSSMEDNLLSLIIQNPDLMESALTVPVEYFESSENAEIFLKWCKYSNIDDIEMNIDPVLQPHLQDLINMEHPVIENKADKIKLVFYDYVDRLHERHIRNTLRRKAEILSSEKESGTEGDIIDKFEEQVTPEIEELKKIFLDRKQRRQIIA